MKQFAYLSMLVLDKIGTTQDDKLKIGVSTTLNDYRINYSDLQRENQNLRNLGSNIPLINL
ncbi:MAG: hypothetical protein GX140_06035 [Bacteroidales bacterium]|nr:hypothetical protein [Bacteroidales bacterium]